MIAVTTDPSSSSSRRSPRDMYLLPTLRVKSMAPVLVGKQSNCGSFGFSSCSGSNCNFVEFRMKQSFSITLPRLFLGVTCVLGGGERESEAVTLENIFHSHSGGTKVHLSVLYRAHTLHTCTQHTLRQWWDEDVLCWSPQTTLLLK